MTIMKTIKNRAYSFNHTKERMMSRYDILIDEQDYNEMCERVDKKQDVILISNENQKKDVQQIYDIFFKIKSIKVVWSKANRLIKTVLPYGG